MKKFSVFAQCKISGFIEIEADSLESAKQKAIRLDNEGVSHSELKEVFETSEVYVFTVKPLEENE
jgi:hypothetical protein